mmetsp:Transcript_9378/g.27026  ORF Transcript_9378/g.27026 Transcript_9378/m.27026 type:complete len:273 (+) Transcript_9378:181-999(+)
MGCTIFRTMRCALAACILWWVGMFLFGASTIMNDVDEAERTLFSRMRSAPRAVEVPEAKFRIWESTRGICGSASIGNDTITASPAEAERLCERTEGCTFFTRWGETSTSVCSLPSTAWPKDEYFRAGTTVLCNKFMSLRHQEVAMAEAKRRGVAIDWPSMSPAAQVPAGDLEESTIDGMTRSAGSESSGDRTRWAVGARSETGSGAAAGGHREALAPGAPFAPSPLPDACAAAPRDVALAMALPRPMRCAGDQLVPCAIMVRGYGSCRGYDC